jgi:hypothetical protein
MDHEECQNSGQVFWNNTCVQLGQVCSQLGLGYDVEDGVCLSVSGSDSIGLDTLVNRTSASAEYFERYVLGNQGNDWYNFGTVRWQNVGCLTAAWLLVALCLIKVIFKMMYLSNTYYLLFTGCQVQWKGCLLHLLVSLCCAYFACWPWVYPSRGCRWYRILPKPRLEQDSQHSSLG